MDEYTHKCSHMSRKYRCAEVPKQVLKPTYCQTTGSRPISGSTVMLSWHQTGVVWFMRDGQDIVTLQETLWFCAHINTQPQQLSWLVYLWLSSPVLQHWQERWGLGAVGA
jgi:hypothetical protein